MVVQGCLDLLGAFPNTQESLMHAIAFLGSRGQDASCRNRKFSTGEITGNLQGYFFKLKM